MLLSNQEGLLLSKKKNFFNDDICSLYANMFCSVQLKFVQQSYSNAVVYAILTIRGMNFYFDTGGVITCNF